MYVFKHNESVKLKIDDNVFSVFKNNRLLTRHLLIDSALYYISKKFYDGSKLSLENDFLLQK